MRRDTLQRVRLGFATLDLMSHGRAEHIEEDTWPSDSAETSEMSQAMVLDIQKEIREQ